MWLDVRNCDLEDWHKGAAASLVSVAGLGHSSFPLEEPGVKSALLASGDCSLSSVGARLGREVRAQVPAASLLLMGSPPAAWRLCVAIIIEAGQLAGSDLRT